MKITTILFKIFKTFVTFLIVILACGGIIFTYYSSEHFYDNLFKDKEKIECIIESYRNSTPIDNNLKDYKIDFKDKKLYISTETCSSICEFDDNGKILESSFTLVRKPYLLYILGYLFFISFMVYASDFINDNTNTEKES